MDENAPVSDENLITALTDSARVSGPMFGAMFTKVWETVNMIRAAELRFSFYVSDLTRPPEDSEKKLETPTNLEILSDNLNIFYKQ